MEASSLEVMYAAAVKEEDSSDIVIHDPQMGTIFYTCGKMKTTIGEQISKDARRREIFPCTVDEIITNRFRSRVSCMLLKRGISASKS